jgi:hypothetical protein
MIGFDLLLIPGSHCLPLSIFFDHHHPHVPIFRKSGSIDVIDVTIDLFQLFCHTYILAASEITATEESQKFLHRSEGVSAPHRNHWGTGESEAFSVPL